MRLARLLAFAILLVGFATLAHAAAPAERAAALREKAKELRPQIATLRQAIRQLIEASARGDEQAVLEAARKVRDAWQAIPEPIRARIKERLQNRGHGPLQGKKPLAQGRGTGLAL